MLGSEGIGIAEELKKLANIHLTIEGVTHRYEFPFNLVDSLNVGVSTGIIVEQFYQQKRKFEENL